MPEVMEFIRTFNNKALNKGPYFPRYDLMVDDLLVASFIGDGYKKEAIKGLLLGSWYQWEYGEIMRHPLDFSIVESVLASCNCFLEPLDQKDHHGNKADRYLIRQDSYWSVREEEHELFTGPTTRKGRPEITCGDD